MLTFPVNLWITQRETVTVAVLFMKPALVTTPLNAMGGIVDSEEYNGKRLWETALYNAHGKQCQQLELQVDIYLTFSSIP
jgi:hypothetical protein